MTNDMTNLWSKIKANTQRVIPVDWGIQLIAVETALTSPKCMEAICTLFFQQADDHDVCHSYYHH